jgi:hypothetical protein
MLGNLSSGQNQRDSSFRSENIEFHLLMVLDLGSKLIVDHKSTLDRINKDYSSSTEVSAEKHLIEAGFDKLLTIPVESYTSVKFEESMAEMLFNHTKIVKLLISRQDTLKTVISSGVSGNMVKFFLICYRNGMISNYVVEEVLKNLRRIFVYSNESQIKIFGQESCPLEVLIREQCPVEKKLAIQKFVEEFDHETDSDLIQFARSYSHVLQHKFVSKLIEKYEEDPAEFIKWIIS